TAAGELAEMKHLVVLIYKDRPKFFGLKVAQIRLKKLKCCAATGDLFTVRKLLRGASHAYFERCRYGNGFSLSYAIEFTEIGNAQPTQVVPVFTHRFQNSPGEVYSALIAVAAAHYNGQKFSIRQGVFAFHQELLAGPVVFGKVFKRHFVESCNL